MSTYLSIGQTDKKLDVSIVTVRRWDKKCKLKSSFRTIGGHRRFKLSLINKILGINKPKIKVGYDRVSSYDQKNDLNSQMGVLKKHTHFFIDLGSGINFNKKGLNKLLSLIFNK